MSENLSDLLGFLFIDMQLPIFVVVTKGNDATHPHTLLFRGGYFVPDAFTCHLSFKLREGKQDIQSESAHRGCRIELLCDGHKANSFAVEGLDDLGKVCQRTSETVDLVNHNCVDLPCPNVIKKPFKTGPLHVAA